VLDKFLLFGLAANDAWNDDKKTDEGDARKCYHQVKVQLFMTDSHPVDDLGCLFRIQIHKSHIFNVEFRSHSIPCVVQVQAFKITDTYEGFNSYWKSEYEVLSFFISS